MLQAGQETSRTVWHVMGGGSGQSEDASHRFLDFFLVFYLIIQIPVSSLCLSADLVVPPGATAVRTHVSVQSRKAAELSATHHTQQSVVEDTTLVIVENYKLINVEEL